MNYAERFSFVENQAYGKQVTVALWLAAARLLVKGTDPEKVWARATLRTAADTDMQRLVMIRVASSSALDAEGASKRGVDDETLQAIVDALVPDLIGD